MIQANDEFLKALDDVYDSAMTGLDPEEGDYARYENENDPDAGVVICRKDGTVIIWMPTGVWDELVKHNDNA